MFCFLIYFELVMIVLIIQCRLQTKTFILNRWFMIALTAWGDRCHFTFDLCNFCFLSQETPMLHKGVMSLDKLFQEIYSKLNKKITSDLDRWSALPLSMAGGIKSSCKPNVKNSKLAYSNTLPIGRIWDNMDSVKIF